MALNINWLRKQVSGFKTQPQAICLTLASIPYITNTRLITISNDKVFAVNLEKKE